MKKTPILILVAVILMLAACIVALLGERNKLNNRLNYQSALQQEQSEQMLANEGSKATLSEQNEALTQENQALTQQLQETRDELDALKAEAETVRAHTAAMEADYQQKLEAAQMENAMLSNIQQELNNQLASQKDIVQQTLEETLGDLQQAEQANAKLTEKLKADEEEITRLNAELTAANSVIASSEASNEIKTLKEQINGLSAALTAAEQQTREAENNYTLCQDTIAMLNDRHEEQERTIAALRASADGNTADTAETSRELAALRDENERLTQQYDALCLELQPIRDESETLRAENLQLQEQLRVMAEQGESNAAELLRLLNEDQKDQPEQTIPKVDKLFITCENKYHKKTYFKITPEEALLLEITPGTVAIQVQLLDAEGNIISYR